MQLKKKTLHCTKVFTFTLAIIACFLILYILMSVIGDNFLNIILVFNSIVAVFLGVTAVLYFGKFGDKHTTTFSDFCFNF
jgi:uncharacterized membrane protein YbhN (UPF0104 family)